MEQGQQMITIQYVGEPVNNPQILGSAALAALTTIGRAGCYVNAEVNPTVHNFNETDVARVVAAVANKSKAEGITIKVENTKKPALSREDGERLINALKGLFEFE